MSVLVRAILSFFFLFSIIFTASGTTYYVDPDGNDLNSGTSWLQAFATIQHGISIAGSEDVVEVNEGTYYENIDYDGKDITVRSTNPDDWIVVAATIINANGSGRVVTFDNGEEDHTVLSGFTITGGSYAGQGGGIYCNAQPIITKCMIKDNIANSGGGIFIYDSPEITACIFQSNTAQDYGGAMVTSSCASPTIRNCTFVDNDANNGGGIANIEEGYPAVENCIFARNAAEDYGGGLYNDDTDDGTNIKNCLFYDNQADKGGGIYNTGCTMLLPITNCTLTENIALTSGGGIYNHNTTNLTLSNSIFWADTNGEIINDSSSPTVTYSCVQGGYAGTGNISADPYFIDDDVNDFHLAADSPCIDVGNPSGIYSNQTDIDGDPRTMGASDTVDIGADEAKRVYNQTSQIWHVTVNEAINVANNGDQILIYPGTYTEYIDFNGKSITLQSLNPNDPNIITNTILEPDNPSLLLELDSGEDSNTVIEGFTLRDAGYSAITIANESDPIIRKCVIEDCGYAFKISSQSDPEISNCIMRYNTDYAVYSANSTPKIMNNLIYDNYAGVQLMGLDYAPLLQNNTIVNNTNYGVWKGESGADPKPNIKNCIIWDNGTDLYSSFVAQYSCISDAFDANDPSFIGSINSDPCFVDSDANDYHLSANSPCLDIGDSNETYTCQTDLDGGERLIDLFSKGDNINDADIGSDEFIVDDIIYVDIDASPGGNGSEAAPYKYLQDAIDVADELDEIRVAEGIYYPDINESGTHQDEQDETFQLKKGVVLKGGYSGYDSPQPFSHSIESYLTILSGDIEQDGTNKSYHVITGGDYYTTLDGFTISDGDATPLASPYNKGGGIYSDSYDIILKNCTFTSNKAGYGGAAYLSGEDRDIIVENCIFENNICWLEDPRLSIEPYGGAMLLEGVVLANISNCTFKNNTSGQAVEPVSGSAGAIAIRDNATYVDIMDCKFIDNSAGYRGGAIRTQAAMVYILNCVFSNNLATHQGSAIQAIGSSEDYATLTLSNSVIVNTESQAGAIYCHSLRIGQMGNCTVYGNGVEFSYANSASTPLPFYLRNCIFNGNDSSCMIRSSGYDGLAVQYCAMPIVFQNENSDNNQDVDEPSFVNLLDPDGPDDIWATRDDGLGLRTDSPCIDAGYNGYVSLFSTPTDITGNHRIKDGDHDTVLTVDMGAYELPRIWYVDNAVLDSEYYGTSWEDAFGDFQDGLDAASANDEIWVAVGDRSYLPSDLTDPLDSRTATFQLTNGVGHYGGFLNVGYYTEIVSGGYDCIARRNYDGALIAWGRNYRDQDGIFTDTCFIDFDAGPYNNHAIRSNGSLVVWGSDPDDLYPPPSGTNFVAVSAGNKYALALTEVGQIVAWGRNADSLCSGVPNSQEDPENDGIYYSQDIGYQLISAGEYNALAVKADGTIAVWGRDQHKIDILSPPPDSGFLAIAAGKDYCLALKSNHQIIAWGSDNCNRCSDIPGYSTAVQKPGKSEYWYYSNLYDFDSISTRYDHSVALKSNGKIAAWGSNSHGKCSDMPGGSEPVDGQDYAWLSNEDYFAAVTAGHSHSLALKTDGSLEAWGNTGSDIIKTIHHLKDTPETSLNDRDWQDFETVLSGDLNGDDEPGFTNYGENCYNVVRASNTDSNTILDGFTVESGNAELPRDFQYGGGMYIHKGNPTVRNCKFIDSIARRGGGVGIYSISSPVLKNCVFRNNSAYVNCAGVYNWSFDSDGPKIINCVFNDNIGDAIFNKFFSINEMSSAPEILNCVFTGNTGNAIKIEGHQSSYAKITNCTFYDNGCGLDNDDSKTIVANCVFWDNTTEISESGIRNPLFINSDIEDCGGSGVAWALDGDLDGGGNIDEAPSFYNSELPAGDDGIWATSDDGLILYGDSECIDSGNNDYVTSDMATDIVGEPRIADGDYDGEEIVDMGAYEVPIYSGIVVMCWIDESKGGDGTYYANSGDFFDDLADYNSVVQSLEYEVKSTCLVPGNPGEIADVLPEGYGYNPSDPPGGITIEDFPNYESDPPPTLNDFVYHFERVSQGVRPEYVLLITDVSGSLGLKKIDCAPFYSYTAFKSWLEIYYPEATVITDENFDGEDWVDAMESLLDDEIP